MNVRPSSKFTDMHNRASLLAGLCTKRPDGDAYHPGDVSLAGSAHSTTAGVLILSNTVKLDGRLASRTLYYTVEMMIFLGH